MHYSGVLSLTRLLSYHNKLASLSDEALNKLFDDAWWYVVKKIKLKPHVFSVSLNKECIHLLNGSLLSQYGRVYLKEVIDVYGVESSLPVGYKATDEVTMLDKLSFPDGIFYWDGALLYGDGIINIGCYPYPIYNKENIPPSIGFSLIAMMQSLYAKYNQDLHSSGIYENIALHYINLYNACIEEPKVSAREEVLRLKPYEL